MGPAGPLMTRAWARLSREVLGEAGETHATRVFGIIYYEENRAARLAQMCGLDFSVLDDGPEVMQVQVSGPREEIVRFANLMGFDPEEN